ncbi:MAG: DUF438 domain-containing protein [Lachnospiraceae bacterium]|nr:DUF438 domain-containing protein [Lachnospiraceae bacterium]
MGKSLDLSKSVYELLQQYPELKETMIEIGFKDLSNPAKLNTIGRIMTIPKGCLVKGFEIPVVLKQLEDAGYEPEGKKPALVSKFLGKNGQVTEETEDALKAVDQAKKESVAAETEDALKAADQAKKETAATEEELRNQKIKSYIMRLSDGEDLESVRKDFVREFKDVDALEIVKAEQAMINEGMALEKVQSLCDVHSALFHGATREEQIMNAEKAVEASRARQEGKENVETVYTPDKIARSQAVAHDPATMQDKKAIATRLSYTVNHPVYVFTKENNAVEKQLAKSRDLLEAARKAYQAVFGNEGGEGSRDADSQDRSILSEANGELLDALKTDRKIAMHYAKKGDLIYPLLASKYEIVGPSNVMWGVDDEIRDEIRYLAAGLPKEERLENWYQRIEDVLTRADEMVYKERNILLPMCAVTFSEADWKQMSFDLQDYDPCFTEEFPIWDEAAEIRRPEPSIQGDEVRFPVGHMTAKQINAVLDTIPMEISFIDENDINRYFNQQQEKKAFKRPDAALDREVYFCHPARIEPMVRAVITDLKAGVRDSEDVWMMKNGRPTLVRYMAVRDADGSYVGTMEAVQDLSFAEKHFREM